METFNVPEEVSAFVLFSFFYYRQRCFDKIKIMMSYINKILFILSCLPLGFFYFIFLNCQIQHASASSGLYTARKPLTARFHAHRTEPRSGGSQSDIASFWELSSQMVVQHIQKLETELRKWTRSTRREPGADLTSLTIKFTSNVVQIKPNSKRTRSCNIDSTHVYTLLFTPEDINSPQPQQ